VARAGQAVYIQDRDGYEVQGFGWKGGGSGVLWGARVVYGCEARCKVLSEHGVGSGEREDKSSCRCCAPMVPQACDRRFMFISRQPCIFCLFCCCCATTQLALQFNVIAGTRTGGVH